MSCLSSVSTSPAAKISRFSTHQQLSLASSSELAFSDNNISYIADEDDEDEGFKLPKLIRHLQTILQQYPDDGQILKVNCNFLVYCSVADGQIDNSFIM